MTWSLAMVLGKSFSFLEKSKKIFFSDKWHELDRCKFRYSRNANDFILSNSFDLKSYFLYFFTGKSKKNPGHSESSLFKHFELSIYYAVICVLENQTQAGLQPMDSEGIWLNQKGPLLDHVLGQCRYISYLQG